MNLNNFLMKYLNMLSSLLLLFSFTISVYATNLSSYLKIDIIEAMNLHCKLNNEFYCNPYTIIEFKYSSESKSTKREECTKNPQWNSNFVFTPESCKDIVYVYFYQFLTPRDNAFLGESIIDENLFEKGNIRPGYLGRVIIELEKLAFGVVDEWFMIESPYDISKIMFPSCVHLRIYWTSTVCQEPNINAMYEIKSMRKDISPVEKIKFEPTNFIPLCKKDFANIYKSRFSILDNDTPINKITELDNNPSKRCLKDPNQDYGFDHPSNLTSIEEALAYKIIKRTTGEILDYLEFSKNFHKIQLKNLQTYKQFFEMECFKSPDLTIERINNILHLDTQDLQLNTTNPFVTIDEKKLDISLKLAKQRDDNVYHNTLDQFNSIEDVKNLDKMDDDTYLKTLNKMVNTIKGMEVENKTDYTIFYLKNKVTMTNFGLVHEKEEKFFRVYALYKWNGGHIEYDELKKEFLLRRKNFYCYELVKLMPTNIIFQFVEEVCPTNYVCIDPNGIIIKSYGKDPRKIFAHELNKGGLEFYKNFYENPELNKDTNKRINMRFSSLENKKNSNNLNFQNKKAENTILKNTKQNEEQKMNSDLLNFQTILKMESGIIVESNTLPDVINDSEKLWLNKFDRLYFERRKRIQLKKEIIINKIYSHIPILGEILALANIQILDKNINEEFLNRETNLFKKYLLLYNANLPFVEKAARVLLDLILCNRDSNRIRFILNEMLEGLCFGDDRSIKILEEIMRTLIIDSLLKTNYFLFEELHAKVNLLRTFNKPFCFKTIIKIKFIEKMVMLDTIKEKITYIIWNNDTNKKILLQILEVEKSIPLQLPENQRLFSYKKGMAFDNARDVNTNFLNNLIENKNSNNEFKFKSVDNIKHNNTDKIENQIKLVMNRLDSQLKINHSDSGKIINNNYLENKNFEDLDNDENIGDYENGRDLIKEKNKRNLNLENKKKINNNKILNKNLDIKYNKDLTVEKKEVEILKDITKRVKDLKNILKSKKDNKDNRNNKVEVNDNLINTILKDDLEDLFKEIKFKESNINIDELPENKSVKIIKDNKLPKFKELENQIFNEDSENFSNLSLDQYNNPNVYEKHDPPGMKVFNTNKQPSQQDILEKVMKDPETRKLMDTVKSNPKNKIIMPKEIHSVYEIDKRGTKQITINKDSI